MSDEPGVLPIRVGVVGLGRRGTFLLERWLAGDAVQVIAACDSDTSALDRSGSLCGRLTADPADLLNDPSIDALVVTVPFAAQASLARRVLAAGKHVVVEPPVAASLGEVRLLFEAAAAAGRTIVAWSPGREGPDFLAVEATIRSGLIGMPRLIRFERWEPMVRDEPAAPLPRPVVSLLDQLLALAGEPASSVFAAPIGDAGATVTVGFESGLRGLLMLHGAASVRIDHGWAIDADRGGYAAGHRWVRTAEGELYELPADTSQATTLEELLRSAIVGGVGPASHVVALRLAALVAAATRSITTDRVVEVEPLP